MAGTGSFLQAQPDGSISPVPGATPLDPACIFTFQKGGVALHMRTTIRAADGRLLASPQGDGAVALGSQSQPGCAPPEEERWQLVEMERVSEGAVYCKTHRAVAESGPFLTVLGDNRPLVTAETAGEARQQLFWPVDPASWPASGPPLAPKGAAPVSFCDDLGGDCGWEGDGQSQYGGTDAGSSICGGVPKVPRVISSVNAEALRCAERHVVARRSSFPGHGMTLSLLLQCPCHLEPPLAPTVPLVLAPKTPDGRPAHKDTEPDPWTCHPHADGPQCAPRLPNRFPQSHAATRLAVTTHAE